MIKETVDGRIIVTGEDPDQVAHEIYDYFLENQKIYLSIEEIFEFTICPELNVNEVTGVFAMLQKILNNAKCFIEENDEKTDLEVYTIGTNCMEESVNE